MDGSSPLYAPRVKVYPRAVKGLWRRVKWLALVVLLGIYYLVPWLRWDRGPNAPSQAILIDLDGRRGWFFDVVIWPQEVYFVTGFLILAAFGLFFATALFGRALVKASTLDPGFAYDRLAAVTVFPTGNRTETVPTPAFLSYF